jgi:hypothetical protein
MYFPLKPFSINKKVKYPGNRYTANCGIQRIEAKVLRYHPNYYRYKGKCWHYYRAKTKYFKILTHILTPSIMQFDSITIAHAAVDWLAGNAQI